ncbi:hypothetical protein LVB87_12530 [Lysobacter sp. KIS68-7]|uniref:hypothetical protein n=1 Tax=Lysobacter sp. KIS68-7 TaxID=2904252 RepID=UPI001E31E5FA|nr:hypothetical protein [Lysobacter sp. KIS68-7]UHQ19002.1 hypothetical protein LVB87_12530 [Lysobacter sp. KIS68-7]
MSDAPMPTHFILTDESHVKLALVSEHVRYMARLLEAGAATNLTDDDLRPDAMTWWIDQIGRELGRIVESARWTGLPTAR